MNIPEKTANSSATETDVEKSSNGSAAACAAGNSGKKYKRVWVDGCFDMMHYGHANALRQAKELCEYLVVGVHSDAEVMRNKGIPVMSEQERYDSVRACKWVDEVVEDAPYVTTLEVMDQYGCEVCVHGDDISTDANGNDTYQIVKDAGRFVECKRTQGVSTTELVGRMLLMSKPTEETEETEEAACSESKKTKLAAPKKSPYTSGGSHFLTTSKRVLQFSNSREPDANDRVVYVDGGFDLFHMGHIEFLKAARKLGDYLLVGVHDDETLRRIRGPGFPLMNLNERVLSVLSCRYVDEVVIGAPYSVTSDVLEKVCKVSIVAHGSRPALSDINGQDPYALPKKLGIFQTVSNPFEHFTYMTIIERIVANRLSYEERNRKKEAKELKVIEAALRAGQFAQATQVEEISSTAVKVPSN
jgi:ethanolamine-phosphate cytidylyltransferase